MPKKEKVLCPACKGKGKKFNPMKDGLFLAIMMLLIDPYEECNYCNGYGYIVKTVEQ